MDTRVRTNDGSTQVISESQIARLKLRLQGQLLQPGAPGYEEARTVWNAMIDRRPALIVQCLDADDVTTAVNFARESGVLMAVRSGGHDIAGNAICEGGLVVDLSQMKTIALDAASRRASVEPGVTSAELDRATAIHGLAVPEGINSMVGVAGLTLGGGIGWLSRKYGLTLDNLESVEIVTADGHMLKASVQEHEDLFWAVRGGGGNFGIVTKFEFGCHPLSPHLLCGTIAFPFEEAFSALGRYRTFCETMPEELSARAVLRQAPPLPFLPPEVHGREVFALTLCYAGHPSDGDKLVDQLRSFGHPLGEDIAVRPFAEWQQAFDDLLVAGARNYWKSHNFFELPDPLLEAMTDYAGTVPSSECECWSPRSAARCPGPRPKPRRMRTGMHAS